MPRVDFYVLAEAGPLAQLRCACRLAEKAAELGQRTLIRTASAEDARRLDDLLWTYSDRSFLPHALAPGTEGATSTADALHPRVMALIGPGAVPAPQEFRDLLINLTPDWPADAPDFARIAEIVEADAERKRIARDRFRQYRDQGYAPESHNL